MSDFSDYYSPEKVNARRRARYIREHAHLALGAARLAAPDERFDTIAEDAVALTAALYDALYDALPPDPDQEQGSEPEETTHAGRVVVIARSSTKERFSRLADCQTSDDAAAVATYHAHLASSGLATCGACGVPLGDAAHDPGRPFSAEEAERLVQRVGEALAALDSDDVALDSVPQ